MTGDPAALVVFCLDQSHGSKRATVAHLARRGSSVVDVTVGRLGRNASRHPNPEYENLARERLALTCPLCGLSVRLTGDTAGWLFDTLAAAGVPDISLPAVAARVAARQR